MLTYLCSRDDEKNGRQVAIKVFDVDAADAKAQPANRNWNLDELSKEYQVLKQLEGFQAENVNQVYEVRVVHDQLWIITEYCPGGSVRTVVCLSTALLLHNLAKVSS